MIVTGVILQNKEVTGVGHANYKTNAHSNRFCRPAFQAGLMKRGVYVVIVYAFMELKITKLCNYINDVFKQDKCQSVRTVTLKVNVLLC